MDDMRPMLATITDAVPTGELWVHEIKWDGWRVITEISGGRMRLTSRSERDITSSFPELAGLGHLPDLTLDGELVGFDESGVPTLHALADRTGGPPRGPRGRRPRTAESRTSRTSRIAVMVFDVMRLDEHDLTGEPWHRRRELLEAITPMLGHENWLVPDVHDDGEALLRATAAQGLEGVVSKRRTSPYLPGERSGHWLKRPHRRTRSVVVGGWRPETGGRDRLGSILVGVPDGSGRLQLLGRVGSGLAGRAGEHLLEHLSELTSDDCPFDDVPREDGAGARWLRPEFVVDVESLGLAGQGRLRQPTYRGLRPDLTPADLLGADLSANDHDHPTDEVPDA